MLKTMKWLLLISGLLVVVLGIGMLFTPAENLIGLAIYICIAMLISGVSEIFAYFSHERASRSYWMLISGSLSLLFGVWFLFGQSLKNFADLIPFIFSAWMSTAGLLRIIASLTQHPKKAKGQRWLIIIGVVQALLGIILMYSPWLSAIVLSSILSFMFIVHGGNNILLFTQLNKLAKTLT